MKDANYKNALGYTLVTVAITTLIVSLIAFALSNLREEAIKTHQHIAALHGETLEEHFTQTLEQINLSLERVALFYATIHDPLANTLQRLLYNAPYLRSLSLVDETGTIVASSNANNEGLTLSLDNFLPIPYQDQASILRIGVPWSGRDFDTGTQTTPADPVPPDAISFLPILKTLTLGETSYGVIASINTDYLASRYEKILTSNQGVVSLWRTDGVLLYSTDPELRIGMSHYSKEHPRAHSEEDFFTHLKEQKHALISALRLGTRHPFVVEVDIVNEHALGRWDQERKKIIWISTFLILLSGLLGVALIVRYYLENERQRKQLAYEKQFRVAMEATQTGVWTWDFATGAMTWDPQCYLLLQYEPDAFTPSVDKIKALTHPDEAALMSSIAKEQIYARGGFMVERRMKNGLGEWTWIQVRGKVIEYDKDNKPLFLTGVYINIDTQKRAEELHLLAMAFEAQEAILIVDTDEKIVRANEAFTRITGYKEEEIIGQTPRILKSGRHDKAFFAAMWKVLKREGFWQGEVWNKRKNGEVFAELLTISTIRNAKGEVHYYLANFNDITTHKIAQSKMRDLAYRDPLTQLSNRTVLDKEFPKILQAHAQNDNFGGVLFIDLDYFKELNDSLGHEAGDMVLVQAANRLKDSTREEDWVVRLGGDEFVIVLENLGCSQIKARMQLEAIGKKILAKLGEPYSLAHGSYQLAASMGCTLFGDDPTMDPAQLIKEADEAMYLAKEKGRGQLCFYDGPKRIREKRA